MLLKRYIFNACFRLHKKFASYYKAFKRGIEKN